MRSMTKTKICIFTETYYPEVGGGETQARSLAEALVGNGLSVIVFTRRSNPSLKKVENCGPITVYRFPPAGNKHLNKWGLILTSLPLFLKLRQQYDLIFVSGFRVIGVTAVMISKLCNKVCILKADSPGEMSGEFFAGGLEKLRLNTSFSIFRLILSIRNFIIRQADCFVAISSEIAKELSTCLINHSDIHLIPNSVDIDKFYNVDDGIKCELRKKLDIPQKAKIFIYTGRLVSYKGLPLLLRVWKKFQQSQSRATLLLVGDGSLDIHNCEKVLKDYVKNNRLQDSVLFTGSVCNVNEYLQASDIFVFPTEREAFGISLIEAMACGLPVISTFVGGVKDILKDKHNGLIIKSEDFQQLFDAIDLLMRDSSFAAGLGRNARQTVLEKYSQQIITQRYIELFNNLS